MQGEARVTPPPGALWAGSPNTMASRPMTFMDIGPLCLAYFKVQAKAGVVFVVSHFVAPPMVGSLRICCLGQCFVSWRRTVQG